MYARPPMRYAGPPAVLAATASTRSTPLERSNATGSPVQASTTVNRTARSGQLRDGSRASRVETVVPDGDSGHLFGARAMDPSLRPPAARAGFDQGNGLAERLHALWR